jgi:hypothetical protein
MCEAPEKECGKRKSRHFETRFVTRYRNGGFAMKRCRKTPSAGSLGYFQKGSIAL